MMTEPTIKFPESSTELDDKVLAGKLHGLLGALKATVKEATDRGLDVTVFEFNGSHIGAAIVTGKNVMDLQISITRTTRF